MPININPNGRSSNADRSNDKDINNINAVDRRATHKQKIKNKSERQKSIMDVYIDYFSVEESEDRYNKFNINYDLMNGRLDMDLYDEGSHFKIEGEKVKFDVGPITHYPIISQVANALHGEVLNRPFKPLAIDISPLANTLKDKEQNRLIKQHIEADIINPTQQRITEKYMQGLSEEDLFNLSPEQQQELQGQIDEEVQAMTPEQIKNYMDNEYRVPSEQAAQQLVNHLVEDQKIKYETNEGAKHAVAVGEEYYYVGVKHGKPIYKRINPKFFKWRGSQSTEWSQHGTWCTYEEWMSYEDVTQEFAEELENKDWKELEALVGPIGKYGDFNNDDRYKNNPLQKKTIMEISLKEKEYEDKYGKVNLKTKVGQSKMAQIYAHVAKKYGKEYGYSYSNYGIRKVHVVWRDKRKLKKVSRIVEGKIESYWVGENYERQVQDIEIKTVWVDELWEGTRLGHSGTTNSIYLNIRPLPGQYRSINNPFNVELPYYGKKYRTHQNNSKNVSVVDLGKPWQKEFDIEMTRIKKDLATNVGSVFVMMMNMKPDNWKWQDWLTTMKEAGVLMVDPHKNGLNSLDPQLMKTINIGKVSDIAARIQLLDFYRNQLVQAMFFNPARIGAIGQYATNANIESNSSASYNQTEDFFETHREIIERSVNALMNRAKMVYKDNPEPIRHIFDDVTYYDFILSPDFWYAETGIYFKNSTEEIQQLQFLRERMLEFIQNGMSFEGVMALSMADTRSEIVNLMRKETKRLDDIRAEQQQAAAAQQQAQIQAQQQEKAEMREFETFKLTATLESQERRTVIQADQFRKQFDVDQDGVNDQILKSQLEIALKEIMHRDQVALDNRKLDIEQQKVDKL